MWTNVVKQSSPKYRQKSYSNNDVPIYWVVKLPFQYKMASSSTTNRNVSEHVMTIQYSTQNVSTLACQWHTWLQQNVTRNTWMSGTMFCWTRRKNFVWCTFCGLMVHWNMYKSLQMPQFFFKETKSVGTSDTGVFRNKGIASPIFMVADAIDLQHIISLRLKKQC